MEMILLKYTHAHAGTRARTQAIEECGWDVGQLSGRKRGGRGEGGVVSK